MDEGLQKIYDTAKAEGFYDSLSSRTRRGLEKAIREGKIDPNRAERENKKAVETVAKNLGIGAIGKPVAKVAAPAAPKVAAAPAKPKSRKEVATDRMIGAYAPPPPSAAEMAKRSPLVTGEGYGAALGQGNLIQRGMGALTRFQEYTARMAEEGNRRATQGLTPGTLPYILESLASGAEMLPAQLLSGVTSMITEPFKAGQQVRAELEAATPKEAAVFRKAAARTGINLAPTVAATAVPAFKAGSALGLGLAGLSNAPMTDEVATWLLEGGPAAKNQLINRVTQNPGSLLMDVAAVAPFGVDVAQGVQAKRKAQAGRAEAIMQEKVKAKQAEAAQAKAKEAQAKNAQLQTDVMKQQNAPGAAYEQYQADVAAKKAAADAAAKTSKDNATALAEQAASATPKPDLVEKYQEAITAAEEQSEVSKKKFSTEAPVILGEKWKYSLPPEFLDISTAKMPNVNRKKIVPEVKEEQLELPEVPSKPERSLRVKVRKGAAAPGDVLTETMAALEMRGEAAAKSGEKTGTIDIQFGKKVAPLLEGRKPGTVGVPAGLTKLPEAQPTQKVSPATETSSLSLPETTSALPARPKAKRPAPTVKVEEPAAQAQVAPAVEPAASVAAPKATSTPVVEPEASRETPQPPAVESAAPKSKEPWEKTHAEWKADSVHDRLVTIKNHRNEAIDAYVKLKNRGKKPEDFSYTKPNTWATFAKDDAQYGTPALSKAAHAALNSIGLEHKPTGGVFKGTDYINDREVTVRLALESGKQVPAEVLADYPDLAEKYGKGSAPALTPEKAKTLSSAIDKDAAAAKKRLAGKSEVTKADKADMVRDAIKTIKDGC
jgi:hypothetical protein